MATRLTRSVVLVLLLLALPLSASAHTIAPHILPATDISIGDSRTGYISFAGESDYYHLVTGGSGSMTIALAVPPGLDYDLQLLDYQGNLLSSSTNGAGAGEILYRTYYPSEGYYFRVHGYGSAASTSSPYTLTICGGMVSSCGPASGGNPPPPPPGGGSGGSGDPRYEPNDSMGTAYGISLGSNYSAYIWSSADVDYYRVSASTSGDMHVTLQVPSGIDYDVHILNSAGSQIASGSRGAGVAEDVVFAASAGSTYYIRVYGYSGALDQSRTYTLRAEQASAPPPTPDNYEPNNTWGEAYPLPWSTTTLVNSYISSSQDIDWWLYGPEASGPVTLTMDVPATADFDLYVYDSAGTRIASGTNGTGVSESASFTAAAGRQYRVKVFYYSGSYGAYTLIFAQQAGPQISGVSAANVQSTQATINWTTNQPATAQVRYGVAAAYGNTTPEYDTGLAYGHAVALAGLQPDTLYHYQVLSRNAAGVTTESGDYTFRTLPALPPPQVALSYAGPFTFNSGRCSTQPKPLECELYVSWSATEPVSGSVEIEPAIGGWVLPVGGSAGGVTSGSAIWRGLGPDQSFTADGQFRVTVRITTADGRVSAASRTITVANLNPVIYVPGIGGSWLYDNQEMRWLPGGLVNRDLNTLQMGWQADGKYRSVAMIYPRGVIRRPLGVRDIADSLLNDIQSAGWGGQLLKEFAYDWRLSVDDNRRTLATEIEDLRNRNQGRRVTVIAHSMGGLLTKRMFQQEPARAQAAVSQVITIGSPWLGAAKSYYTMKHGDDLDIPWIIGAEKQAVADLARTLPAVHQLLPSNAYHGYYDYWLARVTAPPSDCLGCRPTFTPITDHDVALGRAAALNPGAFGVASSRQLHDDLDDYAFPVPHYAVVGFRRDTLVRVADELVPYFDGNGGMGLIEGDWGSGDGTVPFMSAENPLVAPRGKCYVSDGNHASLPSDPTTRAYVLGVLRGDPPACDTRSPNEAYDGLRVEMQSPVELHVYDAQGRHTGPHPEQGIEFGIREVSYQVLGHQTFVFLPSGGNYRVVLRGTGTGTFNMRVTRVQSGQRSALTLYNKVPVNPRTTLEATLAYGTSESPNLSVTAGLNAGQQVAPASTVGGTGAQDKLPPATTIQLAGPAGQNSWYRGNVAVTLIATDDGAAGVLQSRISVDGGQTYTGYSVPVTIAAEGTTEVAAGSIDRAGNHEQHPVRASVRIDKTAPVSRATLQGTQGNAGWHRGDVQVSLTATDAHSGVDRIEYSTNAGATWTPYTAPFTVSVEGVHDVRFRASDLAGNIEAPQSIRIQIDKTAPVSTLTWTPTTPNGLNGWYVTDVTATLAATDATSGVASIEYSRDGATWTAHTSPVTVSGEGVQALHHRATDVAGNVEVARSQTIRIDKTPPHTEAALSGPAGDNGWYRGDVQVNLNASDAHSGVARTEYSLDQGATWALYASPVTISQEGQTPVQFRSVDQAGNVEAVQTITVKIDKTPPVTQVSAAGPLGDAGWYRGDVTLSFTATDNASGIATTQTSRDGGATWTDTGATLPVSDEGEITIHYRSRDVAGNVEAPKSITLKIDKTPPSTQASVSPTANARGWHRTDVQVSLTATDKIPGSGVREVRYRIDGGPTTAVPGTTAHFTITEEGIHEVRYQAVDVAGNIETEQSLTVRIDKTAPEMEVSFDPTSKGFRIDGLDVLSGPQTGGFSVTEAVYGKSVRSYQIKDSADNTLDLTVEVKQEGHEARLQVLELRYNGVAATLLDNKVKAEWHEKAGVVQELEQKLEVKRRFEIEAKYKGRNNETTIHVEIHSPPPPKPEPPKGGRRDETDEHEGQFGQPGVVILRLRSDRGGFTYRY